VRLTRVSQRRGILFDATTSAPLPNERKVEISISSPNHKKKPTVKNAVYPREAVCVVSTVTTR